MKNKLILHSVVFLMLFSHSTRCQSYELTVLQQPFEYLTNGLPVVEETWDDPEFVIDLGFEMPFFQETISSIYSLEGFAGAYISTSPEWESADLIIAFNSDLIDRGYVMDTFLSPITYAVGGTEGNRVFTLEYKNAGFWAGDQAGNGLFIDNINLQMRLFENGQIEIHVGPYDISNPEADFDGFAGPAIGLIEDFDFDSGEIYGEIFILGGDPQQPTIITEAEETFLQWPIPENTVYRFSRESVGLEDYVKSRNIDLYRPNPATDIIRLPANEIGQINSPVVICSMLGQQVQIDEYPDEIDLRDLPAGLYTLHFLRGEEQLTQRIIVR